MAQQQTNRSQSETEYSSGVERTNIGKSTVRKSVTCTRKRLKLCTCTYMKVKDLVQFLK